MPGILAIILASLIWIVPGTLQAGASTSHGQPGGEAGTGEKKEEASPEEKMRRRYPQPVLVADLIGIKVVDRELGNLGRAKSVVRASDGEVRIVVGYGGVFGFGERPVAVPVEAVAMLGRMLMVMDVPNDQLAAAPAWSGGPGSSPVDPKQNILVGLTKK